MEREYTVIVNNRDDLAAIEAELTASTGGGPIPERSVDIANPRLGSKVQTHFMLTDEEATALAADPRIRAVEIPPEQRTDIQIGRRAAQTAQFRRSVTLNANYANWGLKRCAATTNLFANNSETPSAKDQYEYALDGTGVDVVIQDSGIQVNHPEFNDAAGNSRVQQINWYTESGISGTQSGTFYTDYDGHGTHCAGIAAGLTYGWAKGANIYSQKLSGLEGAGDPGVGIPVGLAFDTIRLWHLNKTNNRPTVVNMSWGYTSLVSGNPSNGSYRGSSWTWPTTYSDNAALWAGTGIVSAAGNGDRIIPARLVSIDAEVDDMILDGIHVVIAAGNDYYAGELSTGPDYDNTVQFGGFTYYYHRGSSPHSDNAFIVGNIDVAARLDGSDYVDRIFQSSSRGARVNILAPGSSIMSAISTANEYTTVAYANNNSFRAGLITGTSMSAPQVVGVIAQHLEIYPDATPAEIKARIEADALPVIYSTGSTTDYSDTESLLGAANRMLYSRYGRQPGQISNSTAIITAPNPTYTLVAPATVVEGATFSITLNTTGVPNNTSFDYTVTGVQSNDFSSGTLTGTLTIQNSTASASYTVAADQLTEGAQTMLFALDSGEASASIIIQDTSTTPPPQTWSIDVSNNGTTAYVLVGNHRTGTLNSENPTVRVNRFDTVNFSVDASGHPFWLKTAPVTGTGEAITGVTNNGSDSSTVSYQFSAVGTYYYICEFHSSMGGQIVVS
jgi:subtilisin family serine protease/plastocyanin